MNINKYQFNIPKYLVYITRLLQTGLVIPEEAGIKKDTGFRVKPGMTNYVRAHIESH